MPGLRPRPRGRESCCGRRGLGPEGSRVLGVPRRSLPSRRLPFAYRRMCRSGRSLVAPVAFRHGQADLLIDRRPFTAVGQPITFSSLVGTLPGVIADVLPMIGRGPIGVFGLSARFSALERTRSGRSASLGPQGLVSGPVHLALVLRRRILSAVKARGTSTSACRTRRRSA
jgi:hypothetical protein